MSDSSGPFAEAAPPAAYSTSYYLKADGSPYGTFNFDPVRDTARAEAIVAATSLPPGGRILDYGCGLGTMTAAFDALGYQVVGVDTSHDAIENALPEAQGLVHHLSPGDLEKFPNDAFDLVFAKDVFEHVPEDELHDLVEQLVCIGKKVLAIIPIADENKRFVFDLYEQDETHVTRFTRETWLGFFPYATVLDLEELTPKVRRADKVDGTLCLFLQETDAGWRETLMRERNRQQTPMWRQLLGRLVST